MSNLKPEPVQPAVSSWKFVRELQTPLWRRFVWPSRTQSGQEVSLQAGVTVQTRFPDPQQRLTTAYQDLDDFLKAADIRRDGPYPVVIKQARMRTQEMYRLVVRQDRCEISAGDTEGIRRAVFFLEDEILRCGGPFLRLQTSERRPVIRTRISRCYFASLAPLGWPAKFTDDIYYSEHYLNRLAHEGVNGLWLKIALSEIGRNSVIPEYGRDAEPRLQRLRGIVDRCARYGIKIYPFVIDPYKILENSQVARAHPELLGHRMGFDATTGVHHHYFCTSNPTALAYLEEATRNLFADAPGLGGLINICIGEGGTHCYSGWPDHIDCPRCGPRRPRDVLNDTLAAMERGMHAASPDAELIAWPYTQYVDWGDELTLDAAGHLPQGVSLVHNYESGGEDMQCGHRHKLWDYWLSWAGPSRIFKDCARAAIKHGTRMYAKLQVGCSHEVATAPFVPVPGQLYAKYRAMHRLGVTGVMQCWDFGNHPGVMTRAAGELAFAPFPEDEDEFLHRLAQRDWGADARHVVRAWKLFQRGYSQFPMNFIFGWLGPAHDAPVWPLHLEPVDRVVAPTYALGHSASGDRIGECFAYTHSLADVLSLCQRMARDWNRGVAILKKLLPRYDHNRERQLDIGVATALAIQFESTYNMLRFYAMREELPYQSHARQLTALKLMKNIVQRESERDGELLDLCKADSRLGFHSSVEGYRYFPAKIRWRQRQLKQLLEHEFPRVESKVGRRIPLWPQYTGQQPTGPIYHCRYGAAQPAWDEATDVELAHRKVWMGSAPKGYHTIWSASYTRDAMYVRVLCSGQVSSAPKRKDIARNINTNVASMVLTENDPHRADVVRVLIEPRRLWPNQCYEVGADGTRYRPVYPVPEDRQWEKWNTVTERTPEGWRVIFRIPWVCLDNNHSPERPIRIDVERTINTGAGIITDSWIQRHPLPYHRLTYGTANPADLGWLDFEKSK
ncbi:MAG: hypothetical protein IT440_11320 [Phycisphaeraceae bacterium]|nr:hypothetical protein [Phycisphaeraceae bacterium]